jgi:transporter family protein
LGPDEQARIPFFDCSPNKAGKARAIFPVRRGGQDNSTVDRYAARIMVLEAAGEETHSMESKNIALILGGLIPAILYGLGGVLQKWSAREGGNVSGYLIAFGLATAIIGVVFRIAMPDGPAPARSLAFALLAGTVFGVGAGLISLVIIRYNAAVSQLSPLYNMNVLVTVLLGLVIFSEFKDVQMSRLVLGASVIVIGGWLVAGA